MLTKNQAISIEEIVEKEQPDDTNIELFTTDHFAILRFEPTYSKNPTDHRLGDRHLPRYWIVEADGVWEEAVVH